MNITDFDIYKDLLIKKSGISLKQDKSYLLDSRLTPVAKKWGYADISAMTQVLRGMPPKDLVTDIVEAMTTNETSFYRDGTPYDIMKNHVLPYYKEKGQKKIRIWCGAASSGQEPYSIAMLLKEESAKMPGVTYEIVGTDISNEILDQAKQGIYSQFEVQRGLPITHLVKYFTQTPDQKWEINQEVKSMITYKYFNLLDPMTALGTFDIVFCRNVLIYFEQDVKKDIMERAHRQMTEDGFFFLGGAETVLGITEMFKNVKGNRGLYAKTGSAHVA